MNSPEPLPKVTDETPFPYGKAFKGIKMANVPAWFLLSQYDYGYLSKNFAEYVVDHKSQLEAEKARIKKFQSK